MSDSGLISSSAFRHQGKDPWALVDKLERELQSMTNRAEKADRERDALLADNENLVWNLAGCDTYAMGYSLDTEHSKQWARPALESVRKLALSEKHLRSKVERLTAERDGAVGDREDALDHNKMLKAEAERPAMFEIVIDGERFLKASLTCGECELHCSSDCQQMVYQWPGSRPACMKFVPKEVEK